MTNISQNKKLHAIKISQALQLFFDRNPGTHTLRSTDAYQILAPKGLVERDLDNGIKFRGFLNKLKNAQALYLIPQCRPEPGNGQRTNWIFQSAAHQTIRAKNLATQPPVPKADETELKAIKDAIVLFPKRNPDDLDANAKQTRKSYPRAYEFWSSKEEQLLIKASKITDDSFKLAIIFGRQPSVLEKKIEELICWYQNR